MLTYYYLFSFYFSPFWGEEFEFEIPRRFRYLGVCVYERDRPLGRVTVRRDQLTSFNDKDHWFPLRPLNVESEVQVFNFINYTSYYSIILGLN